MFSLKIQAETIKTGRNPTLHKKMKLKNTDDVTDYIKAGQNNLIIWIGSGWYTEGLPGVTGEL